MMRSKYKNKDSLVMENEIIRAEFLPDPGGKMVSLINKKTGFEFLVQRENKVYRDQPFDGMYVDGECSGYDDMFPTIDKCICEQEPWAGVEMADHGEVWSLRWNHNFKKNSLHMSVKGVRFPYRLEKKIRFANANTLMIEYNLKNESEFDFHFLWAGHFMITLEEGCQVIVPEDCKRAVTMLTNGPRTIGQVYDWPGFIDNTKNIYRADIARSKNANGFEKYYFENKLSQGFCELVYPDKERSIRIEFPVETVPYLGILMNENGWDNLYNIFIEPCTVCYDRPDVAKKYGQVSSVKAWGEYKWYINVII